MVGAVMAENIIAFQAGREAAMFGDKRDRQMSADWLEGYDSDANALNLPAKGPYSAKTGD